MKVKEFYVQDRRAIAVTSMVGMGDTIYLGLTGGSYSLAKFHIPTASATNGQALPTSSPKNRKKYVTISIRVNISKWQFTVLCTNVGTKMANI